MLYLIILKIQIKWVICLKAKTCQYLAGKKQDILTEWKSDQCISNVHSIPEPLLKNNNINNKTVEN